MFGGTLKQTLTDQEDAIGKTTSVTSPNGIANYADGDLLDRLKGTGGRCGANQKTLRLVINVMLTNGHSS